MNNLSIVFILIILQISIYNCWYKEEKISPYTFISENDVIFNRGFIPYTNNEYQNILNSQQNNLQNLQLQKDQNKSKNIPKNWRWTDVNGRNYITIVQNQHQPQYCGSSWAFAVTSALADRIKIIRNATWPDFYLSPQVLLSCDMQSHGCNGGDDLIAYFYILQNSIPENTCSIYQGKGYTQGETCSEKMKCSWCEHENCFIKHTYWNFTLKAFGKVEGEEQMKKEIYERGPITCAITNTIELEKYSHGIFEDKTGKIDLNHVVSIVGYGEEFGIKYWYVRNSWGTQWGEKGFFRIVRGKNNLGIEQRCHFGVPEDTWSEKLDSYKTDHTLKFYETNEYSKINQEVFLGKNEQNYDQYSYENREYFQEWDEEIQDHIISPLPQDYIKDEDLPKFFDWRDVNGENYMSWSINQLIPYYCGSCWAQGASVVISDRINIQRKNKFPQATAAVQAFLNCRWGGSCGGGGSGRAYKYAQWFGIPEMTCKPYESQNPDSFDCSDIQRCGHCLPTKLGVEYCIPVQKYKKYTRYRVVEHGGIPKWDFQAMKKEIYARGPITCGMSGTEEFHMYKSGVFSQKTDKTYTTHVLNIIGWGEKPDGEQYWIGKNSFGTFWGEAGYFKIVISKTHSLNIGLTCGWAVSEIVEENYEDEINI